MTKWSQSLESLMPLGMRGALVRFPIPATFALAATVLAIATDTDLPFEVNDEVSRTLALLLLALFATAGTTLWGERTGAAMSWRLALAGLATALLALRVYTLPVENSLAAIMLAPAVILFAASLPLVGERGSEAAFWSFNRGAWLGSLFGLVIAGALGLGLTLAYTAAEELLGLDVGDVYGHTWTVCLCLIWPLVAFGACPPTRTPEAGEAGRMITVLTTYVLIPVVAIYGAIIYVYVLRIAATGRLPAGEIVSTVGGCAAIAVATHYLALPLRDLGTRWVRAYHRHAFKALIVPVAVLALAVWVRIDAYGFTEPRYVLAIATAWLMVMTAHGAIWPARRLAVMPAALCASLFLGSFGPWGAVAVSTRSQVTALESLLTEAGILVEGRIHPAAAQPSFGIVQRIGSIVSYLHFTGKTGVIEPWFASPPRSELTGPEAWLELMGLALVQDWQTADRFYYSQPFANAIDVRGFDAAISVDLNAGASRATYGWTRPEGRLDVVVTLDGDRLAVVAGADTLTFALTPVAEALRLAPVPAPDSPAPFVEAEAPGLRGRLVLKRLMGRWADGVLVDVYGSATILLDVR